MKPAIQHLKEAFPDWKDWPKGSVDAQVKVMQDYARECIRTDREVIIEADPVYHKELPTAIFYAIDAPVLLNLKIETP